MAKTVSMPLLITCAFALGLGHYTFQTLHPRLDPEHVVSEVVQPMRYPQKDSEPAAKHLYLRRSWYATERPESAWLKILGYDELFVLVNGTPVTEKRFGRRGRAAGAVIEISQWLRVGKNTISIYCRQRQLNRPPAVAVEGKAILAGGQLTDLGSSTEWKVGNHYEHGATFWYAPDFRDDHWVAAELGSSQTMQSAATIPYSLVSSPLRGKWVSTIQPDQRLVFLGRIFDAASQPQDGWMRVVTTAPYRLAINGHVIADDFWDLEGPAPYEPAVRCFDIRPLLRRGSNAVAIALTTPGEAARVCADLEWIEANGAVESIATDDSWMTKAGAIDDWLAEAFPGERGWKRGEAALGYQGIPPWKLSREVVEPLLSSQFLIGRWVRWWGLVVAYLFVAFPITALVGWTLRYVGQLSKREIPFAVAFWPLLPPTILAGAATLLQFDTAYLTRQLFTYHGLALLGIVLVSQWFLMLFLAAASATPRGEPRHRMRWIRHAAVTVAVTAIAGVGLWLRLVNIVAEPIHHDEVGAYAKAVGILKYGFPAGEVHPDLPFGYAATSEITYYPMALAVLATEDPLLVLRGPAVAFSILTLLLLYWVGKRLFSTTAGIVAALLFALSPYAIGMANFGRYFCQLQFFTVLTVYLAYETFTRLGTRLNRWLLWGTAVSFVVMYLSWEGVSMIGPGLALAVIIHRGYRHRQYLSDLAFYGASTFVIAAVLVQNAHRIKEQIQRLWYGTGISGLGVRPMWRYPAFDPDYYLLESSWIQNAFLPMCFLLAAIALSVFSHRFRRPLRFLVIILLVNAGLMSALLPLRSGRYSYHMTAVFILIAAGVVAACGDSLMQVIRRSGVPRWCGIYTTALTAFLVVATLALASGHWCQPHELTKFETRAYEMNRLRFPDWDGPMRFLRERIREDDVVIGILPHANEYTMLTMENAERKLLGLETLSEDNRWRIDYWLQSTLVIQSALGDREIVPRDRRSGAKVIVDLPQLVRIFDQHDRVWLLATRGSVGRTNDNEISKYLRQHMEVAYEDYNTTIMVRDANHMPAEIRERQDEEAQEIGAEYLR